MADITLAQFNGATWLVGGEEHIDDLMTNTLPAGVTIELVACERKIDVHALWERLGAPRPNSEPWMIHPGIVRRALGAAPDGAIVFAPWSVQPGEDGLRAIAAACDWALANPECPVLLAEYHDEAAPAAEAGLALVRLQVVEAALLQSVAQDRLRRIRRPVGDIPALPAGGGRVDLVLKRPDGGSS